uniref:Uncharacterized protein n=1 Tax=Anguilla anguilla TaxID=7936 RepID=A0A0E9PGC8_ANGAN
MTLNDHVQLTDKANQTMYFTSVGEVSLPKDIG